MQLKFYMLRALCLLALCVAVLLLAIAIYLYPGGNPIDQNTTSFDISKNYLCNLYGDTGINQLHNPGKSFALLATGLFCISFALTFYQIPTILSLKKSTENWTQSFGGGSMAIGFLIFTPFHDLVINIVGILGAVSLSIILYHLLLQKKYANLILVFGAIISSGLTYIIYYSGIRFDMLAIMQKVSLFLFIVWLGHTHLWLPKKNRAPKLVNS